MKIRPALDHDIPALKDIALNGLSNDVLWQFCFPSRTRGSIAEKHLEHVLKRCIHSNDGAWTIAVVEAPKTHQVVSFAIWQNIDMEARQQYKTANQVHKTLDLSYGLDPKAAERMLLLETAIIQSQQQLLGHHGRLMFLHAVITHPRWKGNGYAKFLCQHAMHLAQREGFPVATLASPFNGYVFYSGNGFLSRGCTEIKVEGQLDQLMLQVMTYTPHPVLETRRGSFKGFLTSSEDQRIDGRQGLFLGMLSFGRQRNSGGWTVIES